MDYSLPPVQSQLIALAGHITGRPEPDSLKHLAADVDPLHTAPPQWMWMWTPPPHTAHPQWMWMRTPPPHTNPLAPLLASPSGRSAWRSWASRVAGEEEEEEEEEGGAEQSNGHHE